MKEQLINLAIDNGKRYGLTMDEALAAAKQAHRAITRKRQADVTTELVRGFVRQILLKQVKEN